MVMGEGKNQNFNDHLHLHQRWDVRKDSDEHEHEHEHRPCSSIEEASSTISNGSTLTSSSSSLYDSTDDDDDASSSSANSSRSSLYDLSDLMFQLPIKRGLSKFYHGKSDSFTNLARVTSIEDLPKKEIKMMKKKKSYRSHTLPKPTISKKNYRGHVKKKYGGSMNMKKKELDE